MNCLKNETIQAFLDHELTPEQTNQVENHLKSCIQCSEKVHSYQNDLQAIGHMLENERPETAQITIPKFSKPPLKTKKLWPKVKIYASAAAIVTLITISVLFRQHRFEQQKLNELRMQEWEMMQQASMNEEWQNKMMTITITDKDGNIVEQISTSR